MESCRNTRKTARMRWCMPTCIASKVILPTPATGIAAPGASRMPNLWKTNGSRWFRTSWGRITDEQARHPHRTCGARGAAHAPEPPGFRAALHGAYVYAAVSGGAGVARRADRTLPAVGARSRGASFPLRADDLRRHQSLLAA